MRPRLHWLLFSRTTLRHWRYEIKQSALLILIVALGIAVFVSVRLANRAAVSSFKNFTDILTGESDWLVKAPAGTLPENVLGEMRAALDNLPVHLVAVAETTAAEPERWETKDLRWGRTTYTLLGLDLLALTNIEPKSPAQAGHRAVRAENGTRRGAAATMGGDGIYVSAALAKKQHLSKGRELKLIVNDSVVTLLVAGVLPETEDSQNAPETMVIMDLPALQKLTAKPGRLDRVEVVVDPGIRYPEVSRMVREKLDALGTGRWTVSSPGVQRETAATMTEAFRMNLLVLSLIALLVGLYLVLQALDGAVMRRRTEIAVLRSMGVTGREIRSAWLIESAAIGLTGGVIGLLLGWAGAQAAVRLVGQTVNALYYATTVSTAGLTIPEAAIALALSVAASLVAGWLPAQEASRTPPAQVLVRHAAVPAGRSLMRNPWFAMGLIALGICAALLPPLRTGGARFPLFGYTAAFLWIVGGGVLFAAALPAFAALALPLKNRSPAWRLAVSYLTHASGRHRLAVACLLCAVGMTAGMAVLVASFETTVRGWIQRSLQADLYIASNGAQSASSQNRILPTTWHDLLSHPAVIEGTVLQNYPIEINRQSTLLSGVQMDYAKTHSHFSWAQKPSTEEIWDPAKNETLALASESFSEKFSKKRGDHIEIITPAGPKQFTIVGIFADYGNDRGSLVIDREWIRSWFQDESVSNVSLYLKKDVNAELLRDQFLKRWPGLSVYTRLRLRSGVLRIFRQTFSITYALEVIGVVVAIVGLALTLVSVLLDRKADLTTLRAIGFSHREIAAATCLEGIGIGTCGVIGGMLLSLALGWLLVFVINKQSFGWTLGFTVPIWQLIVFGVTVVVTGGAVAYAVGKWGAALPADHEE